MHAAQMVLLLGIMLTGNISLKDGFFPEAARHLIALGLLILATFVYFVSSGKKKSKNENEILLFIGGFEVLFLIVDFILFSKKVKLVSDDRRFWVAGLAVLFVYIFVQMISDRNTWKMLMTVLIPLRAVIAIAGFLNYKNEFLHPKAMIPMFLLMALLLVAYIWTGERFSLIAGIALAVFQIVATIAMILKLGKSPNIMQAMTGFMRGRTEKQLLLWIWIAAAVILLITIVIQLIRHYEIVGKMLSVTFICLFLLLKSVIGGVEAEADEAFGVAVNDAAQNAVYGLFVRMADPAQKLQDVSSYRIAVHKEHDEAEVAEAVGKLNNMAGVTLQITYYPNLSEAGEAFYEDRADAVFIERSTATYIDSDFESRGIPWVFSEETRVIADVSVPLKPDIAVAKNPGSQADPDPGKDPEKTPTPTPTRIPKEDLTTTPFVVYFSGIDVYRDIKTKSRSDVNVLMTVNPKTKEIALVTTPRDAYVDIPGKTTEYRDKLTHAGNYGVSYSVRTLEQLYGVQVDFYVRINFSGVEKVVDLLGGVDVNSLYQFTARHGPYDFKYGMNHMNGSQAVSFARERITVPGGDVTRGKHHIELIKGLFAKVTTTAVLTNYQSLLDAAADNFQTDISTNQIAALAAMQLSDGAQWHFTSYAAYGSGATKLCNSYRGGELWVCLLNKESVDKAAGLMNRVLAGEHIDETEYKYEQ